MIPEKDIISRLDEWQQELVRDVIPYYRNGDPTRGRFAYQRWKERFLEFLRENLPSEADRFRIAVTPRVLVGIQGEHPFEQFMREYGNTCLAFIDDLKVAIEKGRLLPHKPKAVEVPSAEATQSTPIPSKEPGLFIPLRVILFAFRLLVAAGLMYLCYYVYYLPQVASWVWLQEHPNRLGLYFSVGFMALGVVLSILYPKGWKYFMGAFTVGMLSVFVQIVGK